MNQRTAMLILMEYSGLMCTTFWLCINSLDIKNEIWYRIIFAIPLWYVSLIFQYWLSQFKSIDCATQTIKRLNVMNKTNDNATSVVDNWAR